MPTAELEMTRLQMKKPVISEGL